MEGVLRIYIFILFYLFSLIGFFHSELSYLKKYAFLLVGKRCMSSKTKSEDCRKCNGVEEEIDIYEQAKITLSNWRGIKQEKKNEAIQLERNKAFLMLDQMKDSCHFNYNMEAMEEFNKLISFNGGN